MQLPLKRIQCVDFHEHPISHPKNVKVELFEIYSLGFKQSKEQKDYFNHRLYCKLLLERVLNLNSVLITRFLNFQCELLKRPHSWLTSLDMLLEYNVDLLIEINLGKELNNAMKLVNDKRTEYQQVPRFYREDDFVDDNPYQFDLIKPHLDKLETYHKKKAYLLRIKTDYLQKRYDFDREDGVDFDEQIDLELDYLEAIKKLSQEANFSLTSKLEPMVVKWELPQNVFIDFIYQCMTMETPSGKKAISNSKRFMEKFLSTHFASPDGKKFSPTTIRTIMTPSRYEKRPSPEDRIDLEEIIEKYNKSEGLNKKSKT
jgi:hypothetical protein